MIHDIIQFILFAQVLDPVHMIVTSAVLMVYVFDQTWSVIDTIIVEMDLMKLTVVSNHNGTFTAHIVRDQLLKAIW